MLKEHLQFVNPLMMSWIEAVPARPPSALSSRASCSHSAQSHHRFMRYLQGGRREYGVVPKRHRKTKLLKCLAEEKKAWEDAADTFTQYSGYLFDNLNLELPTNVYDPQRIASCFRKRPVLLLRRFLQISFTFGRWFGLRYLDALLGRADSTFKERAAELRSLLVKLGPAFVKVAQAISSRSDVVPPEYLEELSLLQDRIAPFSTEIALEIIEQDLGVPIDILFSEISIQPIAAASLGQVYQARLSQNGEVVAVKVQRPGVDLAISLDIYIIRLLAGYVRKAAKFNTDLQAVVDEWASSLFREMDYQIEAQNGIRFRNLYGNLPNVAVPKMYLELSSRRVLIMEWIDGQKLSEVKDLHLVEVGVYCSLTQLLEKGFYHADPHPGNLIRTYDGKLAYIDFGMMGEFRQDLRDGLIQACLHLANEDFESLADDFVTLGLLPPTSKMSDVSRALTNVFESAVSKGVQNISFGDLSGNLGRTMYKYKFQIPSSFSLVIRSLAVLEGIALNSNPNYKVLGNSYPWIANKVLTDDSPKLRAALLALLYKSGEFRFDRLKSLITESMRSPRFDTLTGKGENEKSNLAVRSILMFGLSEKGKFVKEILLEELTKGVDALNRISLQKTAATILLNFPTNVLLPINLVDEEDIRILNNIKHFILSSIQLLSDETKDVMIEKEALVYNVSDELTWKEVLDIFKNSKLFENAFPMLSVFSELPLSAQQEAFVLPADIARRLTSRLIARSIRRLI